MMPFGKDAMSQSKKVARQRENGGADSLPSVSGNLLVCTAGGCPLLDRLNHRLVVRNATELSRHLFSNRLISTFAGKGKFQISFGLGEFVLQNSLFGLSA